MNTTTMQPSKDENKKEKTSLPKITTNHQSDKVISASTGGAAYEDAYPNYDSEKPAAKTVYDDELQLGAIGSKVKQFRFLRPLTIFPTFDQIFNEFFK